MDIVSVEDETPKATKRKKAQMNEEQVKGLMDLNDDLLKQKEIKADAHERNKEIIVAAFVEGRGPPVLEGQPGFVPANTGGTLRNRTLSHTLSHTDSRGGVVEAKPTRARRHSDADQVPHSKKRDKKKEPKTDPPTVSTIDKPLINLKRKNVAPQ